MLARMLESSLEAKVSQLARLNATLTPSSFDNTDEENPAPHVAQEQELATEIEDKLRDLTGVKDRMQSHVAASPSRSSEALLQRYREILFDFKTEFEGTRRKIQQKRESAELMRRSDGSAPGDQSEMDKLLRERGAINSSQRMTGDIIGQAMATKDSLEKQRSVFTGSASKMSGLGSVLQGANSLIANIGRRKLRNNVVLALVVAVCLCFMIWLFILR